MNFVENVIQIGFLLGSHMIIPAIIHWIETRKNIHWIETIMSEKFKYREMKPKSTILKTATQVLNGRFGQSKYNAVSFEFEI